MSFQLRTCPVCGSTDISKVVADSKLGETSLEQISFGASKFPEFLHHRMVCCATCGLVYATPMLPSELLENAYKNTVYQDSNESEYSSRTYAKYLSRLAPKLSDRAGALDIGAGDGAFLSELISQGFTDVVGVEPSAAAIGGASEEVKPLLKCGLFSPDDYERESFSLITCFQTIEHVEDPFALCESTYKLLKKGGAVFFIGHNYRALINRILGNKSPIFCLEHLQLNSPESLAYMLKRAGFENIEVRSIVNVYPLYYWIRLVPLWVPVKESLINLLKIAGLARLPVSLRVGNLLGIGYKL